MNIKSALILSAGHGTRMGEVGKLIPKPLMPLFEKTLLEYHILSLQKLGIKKIFINTHHLADQIKYFHDFKKFKDVVLIEESELLDVGGGVLNAINEHKLNGNMLVTLSDMLFVYDTHLITMLESGLNHANFSLLGMKIGPNENYNRLVLNPNGKLEAINQNNSSEFTFSGVSILNTNEIKRPTKKIKFFGDLVPLDGKSAWVCTHDKREFYDFGKADDYIRSHLKLLQLARSNKDDNLIRFLFENSFILANKITQNTGYGFESGLDLGQIQIFIKNDLLAKLNFDKITQDIVLS